jgi:predicted Zn-dependent protease
MTGNQPTSELANLDGKGPETWRDLARRIEKETDPTKVMELARRLIAKLDEEGFTRRRKI